MSDDEMEITAPEPTADDVLVLDDPNYRRETVAFVTGAASGIGEATALALACNGLTVVGADVDEAGLEGTAALVDREDADGRFVEAPLDLTDDDAVAAAVDEAAGLGDLRYVANIAGLQHIAAIDEFPMEQYDLLLDVMLRAPFLVTKHAMPHVRGTDDGRGAVANMASVHGHYATQDKAAYIAAKHGVRGLTRAIAAEGGGDLRSFSVSVGYVLTPLMADQIADSAAERGITEREVVENVMLGQARTKELMTPAQVANLFVFGLSAHGRHLNGADMLWDGGYTHTYE